MTASETKPAPAPRKAPAPPYTNPYLGIVGVFLGAGLATLNARLVGVGLADLRGAKGFGFDEASWIPTALNMATMFSGVFVVFVNALFGPRRILLPAAAIFTLVSAMLPLVPGYWPMLALVVIAGLSSGTFYSLTMTFVLTALPKRLIIFGIAAYAADIVFISNIANLLEGWYIEHLSWAWIFWTAAAVNAVDDALRLFRNSAASPSRSGPELARIRVLQRFARSHLRGARPGRTARLAEFRRDRGDARGRSLLIYRDLHSTDRTAESDSKPLVSEQQEHDHPGVIDFCVQVRAPFRARSRAGVPEHDSSYRPLETGHALAWVAVPMFAMVWLVAWLAIYTNSQADACIRTDSRRGRLLDLLTRRYGMGRETILRPVELLLALGLAASYVGLVSSIVLEALESGVLTSVAYAATFSGFMHFIRLFGGQVGTSVMTRIITVRERFHDNALGLHVQAGNWLTDERVRALSAGLFSPSTRLR